MGGGWICPILTKSGMCKQILVEFLGMKYIENMFNHSRVICGQTDRQKDRRHTGVCERA
jgi:hypothetical protein